jgi:hypothetical protein
MYVTEIDLGAEMAGEDIAWIEPTQDRHQWRLSYESLVP